MTATHTPSAVEALREAREALYPFAYVGRQIPAGWRRDVPLKAQSNAPELPRVSDYDRAATAVDRLRQAIAALEQGEGEKQPGAWTEEQIEEAGRAYDRKMGEFMGGPQDPRAYRRAAMRAALAALNATPGEDQERRAVPRLSHGEVDTPSLEAIIKEVTSAAYSPGHFVGYKGDRSLGKWMHDAIASVLTPGNLDAIRALYATPPAHVWGGWKLVPRDDREASLKAVKKGDVLTFQFRAGRDALEPYCGAVSVEYDDDQGRIYRGNVPMYGLVAPAPAQPEAMPGREEIARIIDPEAWSFKPWNENWTVVMERRLAAARAKADQILALLSAKEV